MSTEVINVDPVVIPATPQKTYDRLGVEVLTIDASTPGITRLVATVCRSNAQEWSEIPEHTFQVVEPDLIATVVASGDQQLIQDVQSMDAGIKRIARYILQQRGII